MFRGVKYLASSRELKYHYRHISGVNEAFFAEC